LSWPGVPSRASVAVSPKVLGTLAPHCAPIADIVDWCYIDNDKSVGLFVDRVLMSRG
jgi:hypothetical protein